MNSLPLTLGTKAQAKERIASQGRTQRLPIIDLVRGLALCVMAFDHAAFFAGVDITAESYNGVLPELGTLPDILAGLVTNVASIIFFTLAGTSIAFFERSRRAQGWTEWQISRFLLIRAALLFALDPLVSILGWGTEPKFDTLSAIGFGLIVMAFVRRLPLRWVAILALVVFLAYPLLLSAIHPTPGSPLADVGIVLLEHNRDVTPRVEYPLMGRLSLVLLGYLFGRLLQERKVAISRRLLWFAVVGFAVAAVLRILGGYGNLLPYHTGLPLIYLFIENKEPPSGVFLLFNLSWAVVWLTLLHGLEQRLSASIQRGLQLFGRTALFFYATHILLYNHVVSRVIPLTFLPGAGLLRASLEWGLGLVLLFPLCVAYHALRQKYPRSILRYL